MMGLAPVIGDEEKIQLHERAGRIAFLTMLRDEKLDYANTVVFSKILRIAIEQHSVPRNYLAAELGVNLSQISRWMKGATRTHKGMARYAVSLIVQNIDARIDG